jgi:hypothetical protein
MSILHMAPQRIDTLSRLPRYEERNGKSISSPDVPPGWNLLTQDGGFYGITPEMVVRSTVRGWVLRGNKIRESDAAANTDYESDPEDVLNWSPNREGVFNLGICWDKKSEFMSSLNDGMGRAYPCSCGHTAFWEEDTGDKEAVTRRQAEFLDRTGLSLSRDFYGGCFYDNMRMGPKSLNYKRDRQVCQQNGVDLWQYYNRTDPAKKKERGLQIMRQGLDKCFLPDTAHERDHTIEGTPQCERKNKCAN